MRTQSLSLALFIALCTACASSTFPTAKFEPLPDKLEHNPAGAVIVSRELGVHYAFDMNSLANTKPIANLTEKVRVRITGPEGASFGHWPLGLNDHFTLVSAQGRLSRQGQPDAQAALNGDALVFTGVKPGDILDVAIERLESLPETLPAMVAAERAPTEAWHLKISAVPGMLVRVATGSDASAGVMSPTVPGSKPVWEVTLANVPGRDPHAPMTNPGPFVVAVLNGYGAPDGPVKDVASTWDAVAAWLVEMSATTKPTNEATQRQLSGGTSGTSFSTSSSGRKVTKVVPSRQGRFKR